MKKFEIELIIKDNQGNEKKLILSEIKENTKIAVLNMAEKVVVASKLTGKMVKQKTKPILDKINDSATGLEISLLNLTDNKMKKIEDYIADRLAEEKEAGPDDITEIFFESDDEEDVDFGANEDIYIEFDEEDVDEIEPQKYTFWQYLDKTFNYKVDSDEKSIDCEEEVEKFLESIGFEANEVTCKAFEVAVMLKKITYDTVIEKVLECFPDLEAEEIKRRFVDNFVHWIVWSRPDVDENCPTANFMMLVRYFVKKVRAS